ncbi:MAG: ribosomal L7Ae/L30e/S12e/Gadd45 family protein [Oscillospiraceae bacterium]|nr:ribosomal L7Ae/L30e/S12e/Gadd45 family protein [Oscillospiraceae bacterium]
MLEELKTANKVVGIKQLRKALTSGAAKKVFLAEDADPMLTEPIFRICLETQTNVVYVQTMKQLGAACEISVPAAAAAIV